MNIKYAIKPLSFFCYWSLFDCYSIKRLLCAQKWKDAWLKIETTL